QPRRPCSAVTSASGWRTASSSARASWRRPAPRRSGRSAASSRRSATRSPPLNRHGSVSHSRERTTSASDTRLPPSEVTRVACLGGGVIGQSWAALFLAAGKSVALFDPGPGAEERVEESVAAAWPTLVALGLAESDHPSEELRFCDD